MQYVLQGHKLSDKFLNNLVWAEILCKKTLTELKHGKKYFYQLIGCTQHPKAGQNIQQRKC